MSDAETTCLPARRQKTQKPGIYFRTGADGKRNYEYTYRDADAKQRWVSGFRTIREAQDARADVLKRLRRGERVAPIKMTFAEFAAQWLESQTGLRPSSRARYEWAIAHLVSYFGRMKLADISEDAVAHVVADMQKRGYKPA